MADDGGEGGENYVEGTRGVAMALASSDVDDDETEKNVSEAMSLIKDDGARAALADGLGIEAVDACASDDGYERILNLLLNALILEVEAVAGAAAAAAGDAADDTVVARPTDSSNGLARAVCRLVVRSTLGAGDSTPAETDMRQESMDLLSETLSGERELGEIAVESLLNAARSPLDENNRGEYGPALVLAHHTRTAAIPSEDLAATRWSSEAEDKSTAFRRDLMDLLGRQVFVLGGNAPPATPAEVGLCAPLISLLTKEEFDGSIARPLKFKLMSAPGSVMDALAAFVDVLTEAGSGNFVELHLGGGTDLAGNVVKVLKSGGDGVVPASKAAASLACASPIKGSQAVTEALAAGLKESSDVNACMGLCLGLEAVARTLLSESEAGRGEQSWVQLADEVALPAIEGLGGADGRNAAGPWYQLAGREASPPSPPSAAAAAVTNVAAAAGAASVPATGRPRSASRDGMSAADAAAKYRAQTSVGGQAPRQATASSLGDRIAANQQKARESFVGSAPDQRAGQTGSPSRAREQLDQLDTRIRNKTLQGDSPAPNGPEDADWERIHGKGRGGGNLSSFAADEDSGREQIVVASGAGTSYGVGPVPGGSLPIKGGDDDFYDNMDGDGHSPDPHEGGYVNRLGGGDSEGSGHPDDVNETERSTFQDESFPVDSGGGSIDANHLAYNDAPESADGLAVAVAVSPDEDEAFIPAAIEFDPDSKPPLYKNRRFRMYSIAAAILLVLVVVAVVVAVVFNTKDQSTKIVEVDQASLRIAAPTPQPTSSRWRMGVREQVEELVGVDKVGPGAPRPTPYTDALDWILDEDPMQLQKDSPFITQRYLLALLYFSADKDGVWRNCPPNFDDHNDAECEATVFDQDGQQYNDTFARLLSGEPECEWYGVSCPGGDNFVREIELMTNNMTGTLPPELALMPVLQRLSFVNNELTGTLHSEFGSMKHLIDIEFHYNLFTGTVPESFYDADNLIRLNLGGNLLTGTISPQIKNLRSLVGLFTFDNTFSGSIPTEVGDLEYLSYTRWSSNLHSGQIPTEIGQLTNLIELYLQWNKLTGPLPSTVGELTYLEDFFINNNELTGPLPTQLYSMESLTFFYCFDNSFLGTISSLIGSLTNLERLIIRRNFFTGTLPSELMELENITMIWAHYNDFSGTVSEDFCDFYDEPYRLMSFYTDCLPSDLTGPPAVTCVCCTDCCDTVQETCMVNE
eukprot:CAMPEP_0113600098 /NCGR_PEP_ID=MMETSP0015_2-20120614/42522_1 /TAXON_ID=2838 /ORGANISM="Odontella" /LENGTH=1207 /DNA_ID=CAMNT_0000508325 /DNA_START=54 /DNA_END=3677 /DNA_ORIENTATION=+ /assembly_acc=CAM_ASM_000160